MTDRVAARRLTQREHEQAEAERRAGADNFGWPAIVAKVLDPARRSKAPTTAEPGART